MTRRSASAPGRWRRGVFTTGQAPAAAPGGRSCGRSRHARAPGTGLATSTPGRAEGAVRQPSRCGHGRARHGGMRAWPALRLARHRP